MPKPPVLHDSRNIRCLWILGGAIGPVALVVAAAQDVQPVDMLSALPEAAQPHGKQLSQKSWGVQLATGAVVEVNTTKQQFWILKGAPGACPDYSDVVLDGAGRRLARSTNFHQRSWITGIRILGWQVVDLASPPHPTRLADTVSLTDTCFIGFS